MADREKVDRIAQSDFHNQRGIELADRGWLDESIKEFKKAIDLDPDSAHAHDNLATVYAEKGLSPETQATDMLDQVENMFLCLGDKQQWVDRMGEMKDKVNPDWLCIRTRNPVNPGQHYPSRTECLEVIEHFGEILKDLR